MKRKARITVERIEIEPDFIYKDASTNKAFKVLTFANELGLKRKRIVGVNWFVDPLTNNMIYKFECARAGAKNGK